MAKPMDDLMSLWMWPLSALRLAHDLAETGLATQQVITARMPKIAAAMQTVF